MKVIDLRPHWHPDPFMAARNAAQALRYAADVLYREEDSEMKRIFAASAESIDSTIDALEKT